MLNSKLVKVLLIGGLLAACGLTQGGPQVDARDFKLKQIDFVMLGVRDLARSIAFYRDRLGVAVKSQTDGFAFLDTGAVTLCLSEPLGRASGQTAGATEIVFPVGHVRVGYQALRDKGVAFSNEPRNVVGSSWAANFSDPDGHKLSIFGPE